MLRLVNTAAKMMISKAFASSVALVLLLSCAPAHGKRGNRPQEVHETLEEIPNNVEVTKTTKNTADVEDAPSSNIGICSEGSRSERLRCQRQWSRLDVCDIYAPGRVDRFHITCSTGGTYLHFQIADVGIPNDHWQLKGKIWDISPNTAVTTSPGGIFAFSTPGRVYTYASPPVEESTPWSSAATSTA